MRVRRVELLLIPSMMLPASAVRPHAIEPLVPKCRYGKPGISHAGDIEAGAVQRCAPDHAGHVIADLRPADQHRIRIDQPAAIDQPGIARMRRTIRPGPAPQTDRLALLASAAAGESGLSEDISAGLNARPGFAARPDLLILDLHRQRRRTVIAPTQRREDLLCFGLTMLSGQLGQQRGVGNLRV